MFELRCTVRDCRELLHLGANGLTCLAGHHFDQAREGYWNLLQPQDRRSASPGDTDAAVLARHCWLQRGHMNGLIEALQPWISSQRSICPEPPLRVFDLGCGEGTFGRALFPEDADRFCGIDLSKRAIKLAARRWPTATWVLANADRILPAADASVDCVTSLFGRRPVAEIARVLAPTGGCIVALPGEEDLIELRELVQNEGHRRSRGQLVIDEMAGVGLACIDRSNWKHRVHLETAAIAEALAMTYRAGRRSQQARLESLAEMHVTLSADLLFLRRN